MNDNITYNNKKLKIIIVSILTVGIIMRVYMAINHFTHIDDVGVANFIVKNKDDGYSTGEIIKKFMKFWTYAPFQAIFTSKLVNSGLSYRLNVFLGRLPSLICGVASCVALTKLTSQIFIKKNCRFFVSCLVCIIISLSWEQIIYSAQMEPYAIVVLFCTAILYYMWHGFYLSWKTSIIAFIVFTIGCYSHYQVFILVFAAYLASFVFNLKYKERLVKIITVGVANFVATIPLLIFLVINNKLAFGINGWNVGINNIFKFEALDGHFPNNIFSFILFWLKNLFICFKYLFTADSFGILSDIIACILIILACFGIIYIHKAKEYQVLAIYHDILMIIFMIMVFRQSLTLGPSRHILFLTPIWLLMIGFGTCYCLILCDRPFVKNIISGLLFSIVFLYLFSLPDEIVARKNYFSEVYLASIIDEFQPKIVFAYGDTGDLSIMNINGYTNYSLPTYTGCLQKNQEIFEPCKGDRIILLSRAFDYDDFCSKFLPQWNDRINRLKISDAWRNISDFKLIYKTEKKTYTQVDYASKYYNNNSNGLHLYVLEYNQTKE